MVTALRNGQFDIYIQPKVNITTNEVVGGEVLVRWLHPEDGLMYPKQFIPIFEQNGFVVDLDIYLWEKVFKLIRKWLDEGKKVVPLSINLSRVHVYNLIFEDKLYYFSEKYQVSPKYIKIELTESAFVENEETIFDIMNRMRNSGYSFSIDDFGTGYSAMALLKKEPIDEVKIDKEFLDDYKGNDKVEIVLKHMIAMLKELGVDVIAEGVETMEQLDILKRCGCDVVQGFAYYRALPTDEFEKLIN
ncbi:MAG: EAL domain-containing protein [Lachnospiraceae bacterium]|nr:EAL domain-containing protein [Lachnospiraceae bacterium]